MEGRSYAELLTVAAEGAPDKPALLAGEDVWTYERLDAEVDRVAAGLHGRGVGPGDRVALCLGNVPEWVVVFFALARLRAAAVMMSTAWQQHEVDHALELTTPVGVVTALAKAPLFEQTGLVGPSVLVGPRVERAGWTTLDDVAAGAPGVVPQAVADLDGSDLELALPFSSGTTGSPKAVRHTHRSLTVATLQWRDSLGITETDRLQALTPLSHILGIVNVGATVAARATIRLFEKFSPRTMLDSFQDDRITIGMAVAPIASAMAAMPDLEAFRLDSLRYLNWSATPVNPDVAREVTRRTGIGWLPAYGTTEVPILAVNPVDRVPHGRLDSVGLPPAGVRMEAIDPQTLDFLPRGEVGELVALSPAAMRGYLPAAAPSPFIADGWYRTGDIGHVEEAGWVVVSDRLKDILRVSGHQVSPVELENILSTSPVVADCAVFGLADPRRGEAPCAAIVPVPGAELEPEAIVAWLAPQLASYKQLREVYVVDAIPRTASGKILRRELADQFSRRDVRHCN